MQPHLRKCFEGIVKLQFEEQLEVTHLISNEGEVLPLDQPVGTSKARGQVELWLKSLEQAMLLSVQKVPLSCFFSGIIFLRGG